MAKKTPGNKHSAKIRIRMYNTGFGDCFLLHLPGPNHELKVLIDCGKHTQSVCKPTIKEIVSQVQSDIRRDGTNRVDLLVVTHRHLDHVSGFALEGWDNLEVGEVWMPWTEDPNNETARQICERQSQRASFLLTMIPKLNLDPLLSQHMLGYAGNNLTNARAMRVLHEGFQGNPKRRFLPDDNTVSTLVQADTLPGVEVHVLGPSRNPDIIRDMDPPEGKSFLRAAEAIAASNTNPRSPFADHLAMDWGEYVHKYGNLPDDFTKETATHLRRVMESPEMDLAATLEKSVNGTSLVILFKIGSAALLFPGDAQWGTWNDILEDNHKCRLLKTVSFYKVGHHGSHNATPQRFIQDILPATSYAMIPTDNVKQWPMIPEQKLVDAMRLKGVSFVRSDIVDPADNPLFRRHASNKHTVYVDLDLPAT